MVVDITNLTDGPGKTPVQVAIYNVTLDPGATIRLPAELINTKVKILQEQGLISIGAFPGWYSAGKKHKGNVLSAEEQAKRTRTPLPTSLKAKKETVHVISIKDEIMVEVEDELKLRKAGK